MAAFHQACDENEAGTDDLEAARAWWLRRMLLTPHPLLEKLTLFWHGHFAASIDKVGRASLMVRQVQLLRSHALGRFDVMLRAVARDPAMLVWLDAAANHKALPSQALARTFLETYTLGPGVCSPRDIREAARAFSGSFLIQGRLRQVEREHDAGTKEVLGHRGNWTGDDVLGFALCAPGDAAAHRPQALPLADLRKRTAGRRLPGRAERIVRQGLRHRRGWWKRMLRSNLFFSPAAYRQRIKSPVELRWASPGPWSRSFPPCRWGTTWTDWGKACTNRLAAKDGRVAGRGSTLPPCSPATTWPGPSFPARAAMAKRSIPRPWRGKHGQATADAARRFFAELLLHRRQRACGNDRRPGRERRCSAGRHYRVTARPEFQLA